MPDPGVLMPFQKRLIRQFDRAMKGLFNSQGRSKSDWRKLIANADERFNVIETSTSVGIQLGIIVIVARVSSIY